MSIRVVCDLDGTLALRDHPVSREMCDLIVGVLSRDWDFAVLTGRQLADVEARVLKPLLATGAMKVVDFAAQVQLITCEGAASWLLSPTGSIETDPCYAPGVCFSREEQQQLETCLRNELPLALVHTSLSLAEGPEWWEKSLLVFKVAGDLSQRKRLADLLECRLHASDPIRVGVAGKTTLVVARKKLTKRWAIEEMLGKRWAARCTVFVADEFITPGNDADTADLEGIIKVNVGEDARLPPMVLSAGTRGPDTTKHWLANLLNTERSAFPDTESFISHVTRTTWTLEHGV